MKKRIFALMLAMVLALSACGGAAEQSTSEPAKEPAAAPETEVKEEAKPAEPAEPVELIEINMGHDLNVGWPSQIACKNFADAVNERLDGQVKITLYEKSLGNEKALSESIQIGTVDMVCLIGGNYGYIMPELELMSMTYLFKDVDEAEKGWTSDVAQELYDRMADEYGVRIIAPFLYYGARHLTANKPVVTPEDMKGLKVRVPLVAIQQAGMEAMGASATPVDFGELYMALKTGIVDGQENPVSTIMEGKFDEVQKYIMPTAHIIAICPIAIREEVWQKLTKEQQDVILELADVAAKECTQLQIDMEATAFEELEARGMEIVQPDIDAMMAGMTDMYAEYDAKYDNLLSKLQEAATAE